MSQIHIIPTLEDNYSYVISSANAVILIDCGEAPPIQRFMVGKDLKPTHLLCTHHHGDHIAGIKELKKAFPDMKVLAPEKDLFRIPEAEIGLRNEQQLTIDTLRFECIETPGHTKNHLCFYAPQLNAVFTGDALFSLGCGRLFEGTPDDLFKSMQKLKRLPDDTEIYCGHEYTEKNGEFCLSVNPENEDLKTRMDDIKRLRSNRQPTLPVSLAIEKKTNAFLIADSIEKIAQLRQLRDQF